MASDKSYRSAASRGAFGRSIAERACALRTISFPDHRFIAPPPCELPAGYITLIQGPRRALLGRVSVRNRAPRCQTGYNNILSPSNKCDASDYQARSVGGLFLGL